MVEPETEATRSADAPARDSGSGAGVASGTGTLPPLAPASTFGDDAMRGRSEAEFANCGVAIAVFDGAVPPVTGTIA